MNFSKSLLQISKRETVDNYSEFVCLLFCEQQFRNIIERGLEIHNPFEAYELITMIPIMSMCFIRV